MKKVLLTLFFLFLLFTGFLIYSFKLPEPKYYYAFKEKVYLKTVKNKILVRYTTTQHARWGIDQAKKVLSLKETEWRDDHTVLIEIDSKLEIEALEHYFKKQSDVKFATPVYALERSSLELLVTDEVIIRFKSSIPKAKIDSINKSYGLMVKNVFDLYTIYIVPENMDILQIANQYQETGLVEFAHPNFIAKIQFNQSIPNDPYFVNQFYLNNTGQTFNGHAGTPNADINALEAWGITEGCNSIVVAVLDQGVTSNHADLPDTRQRRLAGSNFGDGDVNDPSPTGNDNHGNSCAGIIGATRNNNIGIAGIAPKVTIMPIRIFTTAGDGIAADRIAAAITFAKNNGADILSNSWGYNSDISNLFPVIVTAIQDAVTNGRGGLGCVVVFAAGNTAHHASNNDGFVQFPANVNISGVLTVAASDRNDSQANYSPTSSLIDISAPSHRAYPDQISGETFEVWSIDIPGNNGYNPWSSPGYAVPAVGELLPNAGINFLDYTGRFGGTSAACPQVAGVAALMLSANPSLSQQQVFNYLTNNADKVGGYNYSNGKSNQLGYGRLNASRSLNAVLPSISGMNFFCTYSIYNIDNLPSGASVTWSASPSGRVNISAAGNSATVTKITAGYFTLNAVINSACPFTVSKSNIEAKNVPQWIGQIVGADYNIRTNEDIFLNPSTNVPGAYGYEWEVNPSSSVNIISTSHDMIHFKVYDPGDYQVICKATTECGVTSIENYYYASAGYYITYSPNPVNDELTISYNNEISAALKIEKRTFEAKLLDNKGKVLIHLKNENVSNKIIFNVKDIPNGVYFLHVIEGNKFIKKQIIVQH